MNEKILQDYEVSPLMEPKMVESELDLTPPVRPASQDEVFAQRGSSQPMDSGDGGGYEHPFKLSVDTSVTPNHLNVAEGQASLMELVGSTPDVSSAFNSAMVSLSDQDITQTVGVWVMCNYTYATKDWDDEFGVFWYPDLDSFEIHIDTSAVNASDFTQTSVNTIGAFHTGYTSIYIGKIVYNGTDDWTIHQKLRSDIQFSLLVRPAGWGTSIPPP